MCLTKLTKFLLIAHFLIFTTGCTCCIANDTEDKFTLASALTKLTAAVEATVRYENIPPGISDVELLKLSTKDDPRLIEPFSGYLMKTLVQDRHAAVLVCNETGNSAILEDAGCTSIMDKNHWKDTAGAPCAFSIKLAEICN